jgi:RNA recognition motif-containing protein
VNVKLEAPKKPGDKIYAVIDFADEETANRNLEALKGKKVGGNDIIVDFIGSQSIVTFVTPALTPSSDPLKLYVTGFGREITIDQLKAMFPTSNDVTLPLNPKDNNRPIGYAFIHYTDEGVCRKAHDASQDLTYQNRTLVVMYGKKTPPPGQAPPNPPPEPKRKSPAAGNKRGPKPKKVKKEEEEDDEDDDGDN